MNRSKRALRLYSALLLLLPRDVREQDGAEIAATFDEQWEAAVHEQRRVRVFLRAFGGLALAVVLQRWDQLRPSRARYAGNSARRQVMPIAGVHFRQILRGLARTPSFSLSAILLLGLGVGSVTMIFTLVDHLLLRPLPYPAHHRLFVVENGLHSGPMFADLQQFHNVDRWAAAHTIEANLTGTAEPQSVTLAHISPDFFAMFGARPMLGRLPAAEDFQTGEGVVLSGGAWRSYFGAARDIVGRTIAINDEPVIVLGVLADDFLAPEAMVGSKVDLWRTIDTTEPRHQERGSWFLSIVGRVGPDATLEMVEQEASSLGTRLTREFPQQYRGLNGMPYELPIEPLQEATVGGARAGLALILGAVVLLLLVACTNVAHLFMARGLARTREMAVRRALGARLSTITTQLLAESMMIAAGGALLGIALAIAGVRTFIALNPAGLPRLVEMSVDLRMLLFTCALASVTALTFGLVPALRVVGSDVTGLLHSRGRGFTEGVIGQRIRTALVVTEVALSVVLVTQASLLLRSFGRLHEQELGFRTDSIVTLPLQLSGIDDHAEWHQRTEAIRASLARVPGVRAATFGINMPLQHTGGNRCCMSRQISIPGVESTSTAWMHPVDVNYFDIFQLQFVAGTKWDATTERSDPQPAVITETLAVALFGSAHTAIGKEVRFGRDNQGARVIGVVEANRHYGHDQEPDVGMYVSAGRTQHNLPRAHMAVLLGPSGDNVGQQLRAAVWRVESGLPVPIVRSLEEWSAAATARTRFASLLFTTFGSVALILVAGGLYGTLLYSVGRRRRELGIRLAIGDTPGRVEQRVLAQGLRTAVTGGLIGLFGAWVIGRALNSQFFGIDATDPTAFAASMAVLLVVSVVASWQPARRAARTDPIEALQSD